MVKGADKVIVKKLKKVLTFGTFDLLHEGHISYLKQAKKFGDELYVLVACDQAIMWAKKHLPEQNEVVRLKAVKELIFVDKALLGKSVNSFKDYLRPITEAKPDIICLGYDQLVKEEEWLRLEISKLDPKPQLIRLKPFKEDVYKTSFMRRNLL